MICGDDIQDNSQAAPFHTNAVENALSDLLPEEPEGLNNLIPKGLEADRVLVFLFHGSLSVEKLVF